jgi:GTP-binding protein YchF
VSITFVEIDPGEPALLSSGTLERIREQDVVALVIRAFADDFHPPPPGGLDPAGTFHTIDAELVLSDYLVAQKRIERMAKEARRDAEWTLLHKVVESLENGIPLRRISLSPEEARILSGFRFVSRLPLIVVLNVAESDIASGAFPEMEEAVAGKGASLVRLSARIEEEISRLSPEEQSSFLAEMGIPRSAREQLIRGAFQAMDYICFLTVGEDEVRAWNVRRGTVAVQAAGKIHSDLERGFIRAEVIPCEEFFRLGSMARAKSEGKLRLEGKEYVVRDGDILHVRFHV